MNEINSSYEKQIQAWAAAFEYPQTPDIAGQIRPLRHRSVQALLTPPAKKAVQPRRRLAWVLVLLLLAASLLAVPSVRAALVQILRAGGITIFVGEEAAVDEMPPLLSEQLPAFTEPITLDKALARYPNLQLPTELPPPDDVLLHDVNTWNSAVIFLWRDKANPQEIALSLYQINAARYAYKGAERLVETVVNGQRAFWLDAPHPFSLQNNDYASWQFIAGNTLVWWDGSVTYRLEGVNSLAEALKIAESLETVKSPDE